MTEPELVERAAAAAARIDWKDWAAFSQSSPAVAAEARKIANRVLAALASAGRLRDPGDGVEYGIEVYPAPPFGQPPRMEIITAETAAYYQQKEQDVVYRWVGTWQPTEEKP